jgi:flagellar basal-body rod protein FlgG
MDPNVSGGAQGNYFIPTATPVTNFQPGEIHASSNPMDFALEGTGYFNVQLPNGQVAYTRGGSFELNSKGELVTNQGYPVMSEGGTIKVNPNNPDSLRISASGDVSQGQQHLGKVKLTEFTKPENLTSIGASSFSEDGPDAGPTAAIATHVRQGFLEEANTSPTTEMSGLVTAMRMFEANQKVMQMQSDRMSRTITELGGTSS